MQANTLSSRRNLGSKHQKMIYGEEGSAGKSVVVVDVEKARASTIRIKRPRTSRTCKTSADH